MDINFMNLKLASNNRTLEVGRDYPYRLLYIDGIDSADYELNISGNVLADGSRVNTKKVKSRSIVIEAEYVGVDKKEERNKITRFFNIHKGGTLTINNNGTIRSIEYEVESFKTKIENMHMPLKFLVYLYCPNPFLLNESEISKEIITWMGGMTFPLRLPTRFAMAGERIINVINNGDVETPVKLELYGPATRPKITLRETGEFVRIKEILTADDVVTITTGFGNKRVLLNGENAFNIIDLPSSKFFSLGVGDNVVELTTEDVNDNANIKISYRNRYFGV